MSNFRFRPAQAVISTCNCKMSDDELFNSALSDVRFVNPFKKGYWPLVINAKSIAFVFSWYIHTINSGEVLHQKKFFDEWSAL